MKKLFFPIFFFLLSYTVYGQTYGNEWIQYNQSYYKIQVTQTGMHRISYDALAASGFPVNSSDPRYFQLYFRGQQQTIYIAGQNDGQFNPGDYIDFFGKGNDGAPDSVLYFQPGWQGNAKVNLYTDTASYFLTTGANFGLRFITELDNNYAAWNTSPYYWALVEQGYRSNYNEGAFYSSFQKDARYQSGEGFANIYTNAQSVNQPWTGDFANLKNTMYTAGPAATVSVWAAGASNPSSSPLNFDHNHKIFFGSSQIDSNLYDFTFNRYSLAAPASSVANASNVYTVSFSPAQSSPSTRNALSYVRALLPQTYNLSNRTSHILYIPNNPAQAKYTLSISSFNALSSPVYLYDISNGKRMQVQNVSGNWQVVVPNGGSGNKQCVLSSDSATIKVSNIKPVNSAGAIPGRFRDFSTLYANRDYLLITASVFWNEALQYASYRSLTGYNPLVLDVRELYDQFGYGMNGHPLGIYRFLNFAKQQWQVKPRSIFIIGKSYFPDVVRLNPAIAAQNYIPAMGYPPTDNNYVYENTSPPRHHTPIGRLAARSPADVSNYLLKVQQNEQNHPSEWMKKALHFAGGFSQAEQNLFRSYLDTYKSHWEDSAMAGQTLFFGKSSNAPVSQTVADSLKNIINNGVALMTFFGHASGSGFDINIEEPSDYSNSSRYPVIIANSCLSGDLFQSTPTISERFVLEPEKGSVAFMSAVGYSLQNPAFNITRTWYRNIARDMYTRSIGECLTSSVNELYVSNGGFFDILNYLEFSIHGDPALKIMSYTKPDPMISEQRVSINPAIITTDQDSFHMTIVVTNYGRAMSDSLSIEIVRDYPKQGKVNDIFSYKLAPLRFTDTLRVSFPTDPINGQGSNIFTITLDPNNFVEELNEFNNRVQKTVNIASAEVIPVYPHEFAVVPQPNTKIRAVTGNLFAPLRNYRMEIDTNAYFSSSWKKDTLITQTGGVLQWHPQLNMPDSTVFYWRVGVDTTGNLSFGKWRSSSFQYIVNKRGWGQADFLQFKNNDYTYIDYNEPQKLFEFNENRRQLRCVTIGGVTVAQSNECKYDMDGILQEYGACSTNPGIYVAIIDPLTLEPWLTGCPGTSGYNLGQYNQCNLPCRQRQEAYFIYLQNDNNSREQLKNLLNNVVPAGHYILAYTMWSTNFSQFSNDQLNAFINLGADSIQLLAASGQNRPYIFFTRKGFPATTAEVVGSSPNSAIVLTQDLENDWIFGNIESPLIGPAQSWDYMSYLQQSTENPSFDSVSVDIIGVNGNTQTLLVSALQPVPGEIFNLGNTIDASQYPYIKLRFFTRDDSIRTPAQLRRWHVLYEGVPEISLNPARAGFAFDDDTLDQGRTLSLVMPVENIGDYNTDSVIVKHFIVNSNNAVSNFYKKYNGLTVGQYLLDTFRIENMNYPGLNVLWTEANPLDRPDRFNEQYHFNNLADKTFYTDKDKINPLLDVTFDGIRIMDGDIVSAKPLILVQLKDENPILLLNDTSSFEVFLRYPGASGVIPVPLSGSDISFYPATNAKNNARLEYRPDFTMADGQYELLLRARDKTNNASGNGDGTFDYRVRFNVVNQSSITRILNYPNPFSTSTRFVFTLTGSELPTFFKIQIFNLNGVIVREIMMEELGNIHIGNNITDYAWDGTDEFGNKLASGVYLYRVYTEIEGENIDHRATEADSFFKKGFGKMYLMR